jgi:hypothetical protein
MITRKYLLENYSTGQIYSSGASIEPTDGEIHTHYWCKAPVEKLLEDYVNHIIDAPSEEVKCFKIAYTDGVIKDSPPDDEMEWLYMEYLVRSTIAYGKRFDEDGIKLGFTVMKG